MKSTAQVRVRRLFGLGQIAFGKTDLFASVERWSLDHEPYVLFNFLFLSFANEFCIAVPSINGVAALTVVAVSYFAFAGQEDAFGVMTPIRSLVCAYRLAYVMALGSLMQW